MGKRLLWSLLILFIGSLISIPADANEFEAQLQSLRSIEGYVVEVTKDQVVIDLDAADGLQIGDLLSVRGNERPLIHPVSGEVIGRLGDSRSLLEVEIVKQGYSLARLREGGRLPAVGDKVERFSGVAAVLIASGADAELYQHLCKALPALDWQGVFPSLSELPEVNPIPLRFRVVSGRLMVSNRQGKLLREFVLPSKESQLSTGKSAAGLDLASSVVRTEIKFDERVLQGSYAPSPQGGLLATADGHSVRIYSQEMKPILEAEIIPQSGGKPIWVSWWQPKADTSPYLLITSVVENLKNYAQTSEIQLLGEIYELSGFQPTLVAGNLGYLLAGFDRNCDGVKELLLGQEFDPARTFGSVYRMTLVGKSLQKSKPDMELPEGFTAAGSVIADLNGDGSYEVVLVKDGVLTIYKGQEALYRSNSQTGGSLASFSFAKNPGQVDLLTTTAALEVPPLVADIDGDGQPEVIAVGADLGSFRVPGIGSSVKSSWIDVVRPAPAGFEKQQLTSPRENPIQALWRQGDRLWFMESLTTSGLSGQGHSRLLSAPLP